jgi:hypothetical protein
MMMANIGFICFNKFFVTIESCTSIPINKKKEYLETKKLSSVLAVRVYAPLSSSEFEVRARTSASHSVALHPLVRR